MEQFVKNEDPSVFLILLIVLIEIIRWFLDMDSPPASLESQRAQSSYFFCRTGRSLIEHWANIYEELNRTVDGPAKVSALRATDLVHYLVGFALFTFHD